MFDRDLRHPYISNHDSNIFKNVTRDLQALPGRPAAPFYRALSFLLLTFIVYGTTVEAAHKHGSLLTANQTSQSAFSEPETNSTSNTDLAGCGACLICQLQHDFSTSLVIERDRSFPPRTRLEISQATFDLLQSRISLPTSGRAPPFTS